jgi:hypothetical protein
MQYTDTVTLETITCGGCAGTFAVAERWLAAKKRDGGGFHCPYCNERRGWWESEADKIRKQLVAERAAHDQTKAARDEAERKVSAEAKKLRKMKRRASCGVCPHCKRSFTSTRMQAHIRSKHPQESP